MNRGPVSSVVACRTDDDARHRRDRPGWGTEPSLGVQLTSLVDMRHV